MFIYPQENAIQKCTYSIDNIHVQLSPSGPTLSDTCSCLYLLDNPFLVESHFYSVLAYSLTWSLNKNVITSKTERILLE